MASTITKQLEQNELIEQIVFIMSTKFKLDNKEASEYVFKKLYENTAVPAPTDAVKDSKETSKKSKKVAGHVSEEAITTIVVKESVVVKEVVKAPAKRSKKVAVVEAEVVVVKDADVTEVVVKAPAKKSKKVAVVEAEVVVVSDEIAKEVGVVKAPAKKSKKVATGQEDTAKESSGDDTAKESKPSKRGKKLETLKTVELPKVIEELQEDIIVG